MCPPSRVRVVLAAQGAHWAGRGGAGRAREGRVLGGGAERGPRLRGPISSAGPQGGVASGLRDSIQEEAH